MPKRQLEGLPSKHKVDGKTRVTQEICIEQNGGDDAELKKRLREAKSNPLHAARDVQRRIESTKKNIELALLADIVVGYQAALMLAADSRLWEHFVGESFWNTYEGHKPKLDDPSKHLRWMLKFIFKVSDDLGKARVNTYWRALEASFAAQIDPRRLIELVLSQGGIDDFYRSELLSARAKQVREESAQTYEEVEAEHPSNTSDSEEVKPHGIAHSDNLRNDDQGRARRISAPQEKAKSQAQIDKSDDDRYWAAFLQRAKAIEKEGMRPLVIAVNQAHFREATAVDRSRPAIFELRRVQGKDWVNVVGVPYRRSDV